MTTWRALFVGRRGFAKVTPGAPTCQVNGRQTTLAKPCAGRRVVDDLWLAVEVSTVVDRSDVERARRRAAALRTAGYKAVAVVAGHDRTADAADRAAEAQVVVFQNGSIDNWDSALSQVEG